MTMRSHRCSALAVLVFLSLVATIPARAQSDGIYADFTTSLGNFTCRLEHAAAPKAVANFIGLATGQRPWLDLATGTVKTNPFYNGITFHRVIAGFMNQAGSPNGQGTDGPGYAFQDEFSASLRHDGFGVLSMANSGPDSNGSQFFITVSAQLQLDNVHTVFGRLVSGSNVVDAINHVTTATGDKPVTPVVIQNIGIRRIGAAALAFDIEAQGLPAVRSLDLTIARSGAGVNLNFSNRAYAHNFLYTSTDLSSWTSSDLGIEAANGMVNSMARSAVVAKEFFRLAQVQYPASTLSPKVVHGRTVTLNFASGLGTIVLVFDALGKGTFTYNGSPGTITSYTWDQEPYRGRLWPIQYSNLVPMTLLLNFDTLTAGTFSGTAYAASTFGVSGSFTVSP